MDDRFSWIINKSPNDIDDINLILKKQIILRSNIPLRLPFRVAMSYVQKFPSVRFCDDPQKYFIKRKMKFLVIRDAGIGDLLLLEPILRTLVKRGNVDLTIASMFPDVFENNPYIEKNILLYKKENINNIKFKEYDSYEDLRNYSETAPTRNKKHRTDIYNEKFSLDIKDKEPRLYFNEDEKSKIKKNDNCIYIGIGFDASHTYRKYMYCNELIEYLIDQDKKIRIIIFGDNKYIQIKNKRVIDLQGKTTIRECINIVRELDYMIAVDSGIMHLALTLHIPTVCIFSIITPDFRLRYYTGSYKYITANVNCIGCGDFHMFKCKHGDVKRDKKFIPPCLDIKPKEIYKKLCEMPTEKNKKLHYEKKAVIDNVNINFMPEKRLVMPLIVLNEEKNLPRFIELVINNKFIGQVIAIDGGSTDGTVELLQKAGATVYTHNYDITYHDMQAMQRNYSCSFVQDDTNMLIMDIDECFSNELENYLQELSENVNIDYALISRRTFKYYADISDPNKQIKDYPDWQPRFFKWNRKYKWVGSPHHNIYNCPEPIKIKKDIIHFECENKNRDELEIKWANMQKRTEKVYV
jgi:ADP-heptose:LPS heptosyltransferase